MNNISFSKTATNLHKSPLQCALKKTGDSDLISFALGMPDTEFITKLQSKITIGNINQNFQYLPPSQKLKNKISELVGAIDIDTSPENIFLTHGSQQAITLLLKLFCDAGDYVLSDNICYPGFVQAAQALNINIIPVKTSSCSGIDVNELDQVLTQCKVKPKALYTVPNGHNPLSVTLSTEKRIQLIHTCKKHQIPIIEDDAYGFISYDAIYPSLYSLSPNTVAYIGTISKIFGPSLRVGWIVCRKQWHEKLEMLKEAFDLNISTYSQYIALNLLEAYPLDNLICALRATYQHKRNYMIQLLHQHCPYFNFETPSYGFFIWGQLTKDIDTSFAFQKSLTKYKIAFLPGQNFVLDARLNKDIDKTVRLCFSFTPTKFLEAGVIRMKKCFESL